MPTCTPDNIHMHVTSTCTNTTHHNTPQHTTTHTTTEEKKKGKEREEREREEREERERERERATFLWHNHRVHKSLKQSEVIRNAIVCVTQQREDNLGFIVPDEPHSPADQNAYHPEHHHHCQGHGRLTLF